MKTVATARLLWKNKFSPSFPRSGGDAGEAVEVWCSRICRFVEKCCSRSARRSRGDDRLLELLSPGPFFVGLWLLLAVVWGFWGWRGEMLVLRAGRLRRMYRCGLSSCGGSPAKTSTTTAFPSTRRAFEAPFLKDFRLLAFAKLPGAMMAAACLQCALTAAATVFPQDFDVIFLFFRGVCTGVIS